MRSSLSVYASKRKGGYRSVTIKRAYAMTRKLHRSTPTTYAKQWGRIAPREEDSKPGDDEDYICYDP